MLTFQEPLVTFRAVGFKLTRPEIKQITEEHSTASPAASRRLDAKEIETDNYHVSNMAMPTAQLVQLTTARITTRNRYEEVERAFNIFMAIGSGILSSQTWNASP
jgi:hypothetical protein